jgi:hypothetical protein
MSSSHCQSLHQFGNPEIDSIHHFYVLSNRIANYRRALRRAILGAFSGISLNEIAERVRSSDAKCIHFSDLESFCGQAQIPVSSLPGIFSAYSVFVNRMSERRFIAFLRDEVTCAHDVFPLDAALRDDQISAISQFAEVVKSREAQGFMSQIRDWKDCGSRTISFERFQLSAVQICKDSVMHPGDVVESRAIEHHKISSGSFRTPEWDGLNGTLLPVPAINARAARECVLLIFVVHEVNPFRSHDISLVQERVQNCGTPGGERSHSR